MPKVIELTEQDKAQVQNLGHLLNNMKLEIEGGSNIVAAADCIRWVAALAQRISHPIELPEASDENPLPALKSKKVK